MKHWTGYLFLIGAFSLAGTSVIAGRLLTAQLGVFTITAVSLALSLLFLLPLTRRKLKGAWGALNRFDLLMLGAQALFGIFLFRLLLLEGLKRTSAGEAGLLTGATPAITAILAWVFLREKVTARALFGVAGTVAGVLLIQGVATQTLSPEHLMGNLLVLAAAACESVFNVLARVATLRRTQAIEPLVQTVFVSAFAFVLSAAAAAFEQPVAALAATGIEQWLALVWYGVFVTALAFMCWYAGISRCTASTAAAFSGMMPFTALVLSSLALGEPVGFAQWAGGVLVMLSMVLIGYKKSPGTLSEASCKASRI